MVEAGFPEAKIFVKSNAICDPLPFLPGGSGVSDERGEQGGIVLYAGRLSPEKGVDVLLRAWKRFDAKRGQGAMPVRLVIAGDGPERQTLETLAGTLGVAVTFAGHVPTAQLRALMGQSAVLVVPSLWYETFGMSIVEGYMQGLPAIVSDAGGQATLVQDGVTGWHFAMGDAEDLADKLVVALSDIPRLHAMRATARDWIARSDSMEEGNVRRLVEIYRMTMDRAK